MNKKKLKKIISLALTTAMLLGLTTTASAVPVSEAGNIKNNSILIGKHIFELDKTKENVYNMDTFVKAVRTLENDNDKIYYKVSDHWVVLNDIHTAEELAAAINTAEKHKDSVVQNVEVKKVNGMFILETPSNYSELVKGSENGTTKIQKLDSTGIDGASKWQIKVQNDVFDIPVLGSKVEDAVDYCAGNDIKVTSGQYLLLLATDDNGQVKGYTQLVVEKDDVCDAEEEAKIIDIKDPKLKETINHKLGEDRDPSEDITLGEMESITELSSDFLSIFKDEKGELNRGITDISGLENAVNLERLDLSENRISDLTPLKNLTKIKYLEVDRNKITDLTPLANLKELEHLNIYNNERIVDVTPISNLTKLKWIDMHFCSQREAAVDVEPLGKLTNLEFLSIDDNIVDDISFTEKLVNLKTFSCNNNYVTDLSAIQDLAVEAYNDWSGEHFFNMFAQMLKEPVKVEATTSSAIVFKMDSPVIGNDRYVAKVEETAKMYGEEVQVPALVVLDGDQDYISAAYNHDTDQIELSIAENTTTEERSSQFEIMLDYGMYSLKITFDITQEGAQKTSIVDIKDPKLKEAINHTLGEERDPAADIMKADMEAITELSSDFLSMVKDEEGEMNRGIRDISGLNYAENLETLDLSENRISDLSPLKNLTKIKSIEVDRNNIVDLMPLANLKDLEHLNIYNNAGIVDVTPISNLSKLEWIDMHYCNRRTAPVNVELLGNLTNLEFLSIDDNFVDDISFTEKLENLKTFSCNNNYVTDLSAIQDLAVEAYNDWSGERFFNMFGQMLKEPVKVEATTSAAIVFKMDSPVTGNDRYAAKVEETAKMYGEEVQVPALVVLDGDEDYISAAYNHDTDQIELSIEENMSTEERSAEFKIMLDYGMYSLKITFDITQVGASEHREKKK